MQNRVQEKVREQSEPSQIAKALVVTENHSVKSLLVSYLLAIWGKSSLSERE